MSAPSLSTRYRTALVTGASTGLGRAFAARLVDEGVAVWGTARDAARVPARPGLRAVALELGDGAAAASAFAAAEAEAGGFDLVINNAGYGAFGSFAATDFRAWETQLQVMLVNTARLSHLALRGQLARGRGALVNVSSLGAEFGLPFQPAYNMAKAGLSALNESLMYEVRGTGVIVIDLRPGDYRTDFEPSVQRPEPDPRFEPAVVAARRARAWASFARLMAGGPPPEQAAADLVRALRRGRSGTVRTGRFFQAVAGPFLARFGSLALKRRVQEWYFGI